MREKGFTGNGWSDSQRKLSHFIRDDKRFLNYLSTEFIIKNQLTG